MNNKPSYDFNITSAALFFIILLGILMFALSDKDNTIQSLGDKNIFYSETLNTILGYNITNSTQLNEQCYTLIYSHDIFFYNKTLNFPALVRKIRIMAETNKSFINGNFSLIGGVTCKK